MRCCLGDAVRLLPGDDPSKYKTEPHPVFPSQLMLAHKPDGSCYYLGDKGCTIHATKPQMCREMDCRNLAKAFSWTQAKKLSRAGSLNMGVYRKGRELLKK